MVGLGLLFCFCIFLNYMYNSFWISDICLRCFLWLCVDVSNLLMMSIHVAVVCTFASIALYQFDNGWVCFLLHYTLPSTPAVFIFNIFFFTFMYHTCSKQLKEDVFLTLYFNLLFVCWFAEILFDSSLTPLCCYSGPQFSCSSHTYSTILVAVAAVVAITTRIGRKSNVGTEAAELTWFGFRSTIEWL